MLSVRPSTKICGVPQDFVVQRDDLEYQRLVQPQALQSIALAVAEARSVNLVLQRIVEGLAGQPGTALARIWLRGPGDLCSLSCRVRAECPDLLEEEPSLVQVPHAGEALDVPEGANREGAFLPREPVGESVGEPVAIYQ